MTDAQHKTIILALLKASMDYNSTVQSLILFELNGRYKPQYLFKELKKANDLYSRQTKDITEQFEQMLEQQFSTTTNIKVDIHNNIHV